MSLCKVHNVRFYKPKPKAIYCLALDIEKEKLAVSRSDASIEIWDISTGSAFVEKTIPTTCENFSVEGLAWCSGRLFSVGLHGMLIEYNLFSLNIKNKASVTGEAAFCLDVNKAGTQLAIGTEQGYLNLFNIENDEVVYHKFLDKQEGRILCLKYDHSGEFVVSGSMDVIRIWSIETGHALHRMTTGRSDAHRPTIVWCLGVTKNFTIISGDSRGKLTFWDGKVGAQVESCQTHRADILALCLSEDENSLYCSGVDPNIVNYKRINVRNNQKWVKGIELKIHEHDIRALTLHKNKLFTGGVDGYLAYRFYPPKTLLKYPPILQNPCVAISKKARFIMLRYPKFVEVWSLGEALDEKDGGAIMLKSRPRKLLELNKTVKIGGRSKREGVIFSTISQDGRYIVFSTRLGMKLFQFTCIDNNQAKMEPVELTDNLTDATCINAAFTYNNNQLVIAPNSGGLLVCNLDNGVLCLKQKINTEKVIEDTITFLTVSHSGNYLVAGDPQSNIGIWHCTKGQFQLHSKVPRYQSFPTALAIHPTLDNLVVTYADNHLIEYDLKMKQLTEFSRCWPGQMSSYWTTRCNAIRNITFDHRADNIIILHDFNNIIVIDKDKKMPGVKAKIPKIDMKKGNENSSNDWDAVGKHCIHIVRKYKHLVHLGWLSDDEMLAVEVNPLTLVEQLPPCLFTSTFGRK